MDNISDLLRSMAGSYNTAPYVAAPGAASNMANEPRAMSAVDPNDNRLHYPDNWKTPSHETFSAQSQWAKPGAPDWNQQDQLVSPGGRVLFDDRKQRN